MSESQSPQRDRHPSTLRIGISTRALFDLEEEHQVFEEEGVTAYEQMQRDREDVILGKGTGFQVVKRLLDLNIPDKSPFVDVVLLSRNSPDLSLRAFKSIQQYGLSIRSGSFTNGRPLAPFASAWGIDLFLSNFDADVQSVAASGIASACFGIIPSEEQNSDSSEVRFAFDGDSVVFSAESDEVYKKFGLEAFLENETIKAADPMKLGPFGIILQKLATLRDLCRNEDGSSKVRIAIVTARTAPAHERVVRTLRAWGAPADEAHFVGYHQKAPILQALGAHIFFDDQEGHVRLAEALVPSARVPGPHAQNTPVIPSRF